MNKGRQVLKDNEAASIPRGCEGCDTQEYVVNKYVLHVTRSFVLYPIVARFWDLITFRSGGADRVHQSRGWCALSAP